MIECTSAATLKEDAHGEALMIYTVSVSLNSAWNVEILNSSPFVQ